MFKVKNKHSIWHRSGVFIVGFDHSQHINTVFPLLTLNKYLSVGCEKQVTMFWKYKKSYIRFIIKVARPISFNDLLLYRIEINCEQITILWTYCEHIISICFSSKFALGIPCVFSSFTPVIWSAISSLFPRDLIFLAVSNQKPI